MAPERPNSPQEETVLTPKMSVPGSPVAGTPIREAQSPISILLAVAQSQNRNDDDLTNLNWLHERDLLKGMNINPSPSSSVNSTPVKSYNDNQFLVNNSPTNEHTVESDSGSNTNTYIINTMNTTPVFHQNGVIQQRTTQQQALNIPYDPLVHTSHKPPYSFSCLIFMAIEDSVLKALPVKEIYAWILDHFPYFKNAPTGWKNSVRHNLSLNKCFQKVEKAPNLGKGSLWTVDPQYKPNLIQALNRSPFHHCSTNESTNQTNNVRQIAVDNKERCYRLPNPELFPYLAKKMASVPEMKYQSTNIVKSEDSLDDVDAAAVMLSLKNGLNYSRNQGFGQVITTSPSEDHTYSAADNVKAEGKDTDLELEDRIPKNTICRKIDFEDEEERRIKEGAETLLNLAGITVRKRANSINTQDYQKKFKSEPEEFVVNENNTPDEKSTPFKPRLLRVKLKEQRKKVPFNHNNNDEWVKLRREIEKQQNR